MKGFIRQGEKTDSQTQRRKRTMQGKEKQVEGQANQNNENSLE